MAIDYTQTNRPFRVYTSLGTDVLLLENIQGVEAISRPFDFQLEMLSLTDSIDASELIRKPVYVEIDLASGEQRVIHGRVSHFIQRGRRQVVTQYYARIRPWLWFLSLWKDCKIFQNMSVPDIVEKVFQDNGYTDFTPKLYKSYPQRDYCVQYRESSFDFVSRLLEEEGIRYYFEHTTSAHTLILTDDNGGCPPCPSQSTARVAPMVTSTFEDDVITDVERDIRAGTGQVTLNDYNFTTPSQSLKVNLAGASPEEIYDYPGKYDDRGDGDRYAGIRLEEQEMPDTIVRGMGNCRAFIAGYQFTLTDHYLDAINDTYLITRQDISMKTNSYQTNANVRDDYVGKFECIPASVPYRPRRVTPKPIISGVQTALVVGPSGEEIYSDNYSRVKVQFYWDRVGTKDQNSSCWIRVSQEWAGKTWGAIFIPRMGQEVIVDFLEGDPDRPIITGRVYNAEQMPPYDLPGNQTQSGIKTRSSKGGSTSNYNEFRFEDLMGSELVLLHAEKDLTTEVENNETRTVGNNRTTTIQNNETKEIKQGNETITIDQGNQSTELKMGNQSIMLDMGNQDTELKMGNQSIKCDLGSISAQAMQQITLTVGGSSIQIDQMGVTITGALQVQINGVMITVSASGILQEQGALTMIN